VTKRGEPSNPLAEALAALRASLSSLAFPLPVPSAAPARVTAAALLAQVDDYLLPRCARLDAPLLVVVTGPTGAGKSTMINSLVRAPASAAGVLRPTTRAPVLVCHPADAAWFRRGSLLGGLARTSGPAAGPEQLQLVTAPALPRGCAFLDTPDIDSVVAANREASARLQAVADLWLFVTTGTRYADAVPWEVLRTARQRGTAVAMLLNRVAGDAGQEVAGHLTEMMTGFELADVPLFVVPETRADGQGLLPEPVVVPVRQWFETLAADEETREKTVRGTLDGALAAVPAQVDELVTALDDQVAAAERLAEQVGMAYGAARASVERAIVDGALLSGEVLARWQAFVSSGEWTRSPLGPARRGRLLAGRARTAREVIAALESALGQLLRSAAVDAVEQAHRAWSRHSEGSGLVTAQAGGDLAVPAATSGVPAGGDDQVARLVREWRRETVELVAAGAGGGARAANHATSALVLVAAAAAPPVGVNVGVNQVADHEQVLLALGTDPTVRALAAKSRDGLTARIAVLIDSEAARYLDRLTNVSLDGARAKALRETASELEQVRAEPERAGAEPDTGEPPGPEAGT
jgi:energy-coupling factor transporter ATP-binding protein EcfA2